MRHITSSSIAGAHASLRFRIAAAQPNKRAAAIFADMTSELHASIRRRCVIAPPRECRGQRTPAPPRSTAARQQPGPAKISHARPLVSQALSAAPGAAEKLDGAWRGDYGSPDFQRLSATPHIRDEHYIIFSMSGKADVDAAQEGSL